MRVGQKMSTFSFQIPTRNKCLKIEWERQVVLFMLDTRFSHILVPLNPILISRHPFFINNSKLSGFQFLVRRVIHKTKRIRKKLP